jgi:hypothetical protein
MKIIKAFGKTVVKHQCDILSQCVTPTLIQSVNEMLNHSLSKTDDEEYRTGPTRTTCDVADLSFLKVKDNEQLSAWIARKCLESASAFGIDSAKGIILGRNWMNIMYTGSEGVCHKHSEYGKDPQAVAIFYPYVPNDGAELVFINNGADKTMLKDYDKADRLYQKVTTGDLVIHDSTLFHTVTEHTSSDPRVCFILEFDYQV